MISPNQHELAVRKHPCARCEDCPLLDLGEYVPSKWVEGTDVVFVGEAPGREEVQKGEPFVGVSGQLLERAVRSGGGAIELVSKTNVVSCRPPDNVLENYQDAVEACYPRLKAELKEFEGKRVVALGKYAAEVVLGAVAGLREAAALSPSARRARWFDAPDSSVLAGKRIMTEYHPAYVSRKPTEMSGFKKGIARVFAKDAGILLQAPEVVYINNIQDLDALVGRAPKDAWAAFDLETNQVQWFDRPDEKGDGILMMVLTWILKRSYIVSADVLYHSRAPGILDEFFHKSKTIAHNGKFDVVFLKTLGVHGRVDFDTMLAHYVLAENDPHGLKRLAQDEYGIADYEAEIIKQYLRNSNDWYSKIPYEKLALYAAWDGTVTLALKGRFEKRLKARPAFSDAYKTIATHAETRDATAYDWPFMNLLMPAQDFLSGVEFRGIGVDVPYLENVQKVMEQEIAEHTRQLREFCGKPDFNPNASGQVADILYVDRKLPRPSQLSKMIGKRVHKGKSKNPNNSTASGILTALLAVTNDPFVARLKAHRRVQKIKSGYIDNMLEYCDVNGRVHADQRVMGTEVGRLAVRDPALQTIPRPSDRYGQAIRGAFIASPYTQDELACYLSDDLSICNVDWDWLARDPLTGEKLHASLIPNPASLTDEDIEAVLVIADYSQAELRAAAHYSEDPFLIRVYRDDRDLHTEATLAMFGTPEDIARQRGISLEEAKYTWDELRVQVKMFNFSYLYGGNENSFAQDTGIPVAQAKAFVRKYEANMSRLVQWKKEQYANALRYGYVVTVHGRRRSFPELYALTPETRHYPENRTLLDDVRKAAVHATVAGTASDTCLLSANILARRGLEVVLLVHDSILIRCPRFLAPRLEVILPQVMESTASYWLPRVAWKADTKVVTRWSKPPDDLMKY